MATAIGKFSGDYGEKGYRAVSAGPHLTKWEMEILLHMASGEAERKIAKKLMISYEEMVFHVRRIYRKISAPNRFQAVLWTAHQMREGHLH